MSRAVSLVQLVQIASPCPAAWDQMQGDDKSRFCSHCRLNVYNFAAMTEEEGERLIIEKEGKLCGRIYRRADGTVLTKDCPVGLAEVRRRALWMSAKVAAALLVIAAAAWRAIGDRDAQADGESGRVMAFDGDEWVEQRPCMLDRVKLTLTRWMDEQAPIPMGGVIACPMPPPPQSAPAPTDAGNPSP